MVKKSNEDFNLSDFALFLSVMKNKKAFINVLSIIMGKDIIELTEVKVENVILNDIGKRAIRLDALAVDAEQKMYAVEMQRESNTDFLPKRSRFYQALMDAPLLKAGKQTRYKELPQTYIIFITEKDFLKADRACYLFENKCTEAGNLPLGDGAIKMFLNMESRRGSPLLVSLLQYMKWTTLDNPEILIKDEKLIELDHIVTEVKQSEEWEAVNMNILERGIEIGKAEGKVEGRRQERIENAGALIKKGIEMPIIQDALRLTEEEVQEVKKIFRK